MAQTGRRSNTSKRTTRRTGNVYVYESTARKPDIRRQLEEQPVRQLSHEVRKNRDKARHMNFGYVVFLTAALCAAGFVLVNYIRLQSALTNKVEAVAALESQLNSIKLSNDEEYNRITSSVDLEEIKRVAIGELGMTYASEGQIVTYEAAENDYMRKVNENGN